MAEPGLNPDIPPEWFRKWAEEVREAHVLLDRLGINAGDLPLVQRIEALVAGVCVPDEPTGERCGNEHVPTHAVCREPKSHDGPHGNESGTWHNETGPRLYADRPVPDERKD